MFNMVVDFIWWAKLKVYFDVYYTQTFNFNQCKLYPCGNFYSITRRNHCITDVCFHRIVWKFPRHVIEGNTFKPWAWRAKKADIRLLRTIPRTSSKKISSRNITISESKNSFCCYYYYFFFLTIYNYNLLKS